MSSWGKFWRKDTETKKNTKPTTATFKVVVAAAAAAKSLQSCPTL